MFDSEPKQGTFYSQPKISNSLTLLSATLSQLARKASLTIRANGRSTIRTKSCWLSRANSSVLAENNFLSPVLDLSSSYMVWTWLCATRNGRECDIHCVVSFLFCYTRLAHFHHYAPVPCLCSPYTLYVCRFVWRFKLDNSYFIQIFFNHALSEIIVFSVVSFVSSARFLFRSAHNSLLSIFWSSTFYICSTWQTWYTQTA